MTFQKYGSLNFWCIAYGVGNKVKTAIHLVLSFASGRTNVLLNSSKNVNLDDSDISLPGSPFRTNLNLHTIPSNNIPAAPKMIKKTTTDCITVVVLKNSGP